MAAQHALFGPQPLYFNYYQTGRDSIKNIKQVFINNNVVNWTEILDSQDHVDYYYDKEYLSTLAPFKDTATNSLTLQFKVIKKIDSFYYVDALDSLKVLFKASFNKNDTITKVPFFCYHRYISNRSDTSLNFGLVYNNDTAIYIRNRIVPCYRFVRNYNNFGESFDWFTIQYTEVFFEKATCLPIYITKRTCQFLSTNKDENNLTPPDLFYSKSFIQID